MAKEDKGERKGSYRNPNGNLSLCELQELLDNDTIDEYFNQPLRNRKCPPVNCCGTLKTETCFYCSSHVENLKRVFLK